MYQLGFITGDEYVQACGEELIFKSSAKVVDVQDYYMDTLIDDVIHDLMDTYGYAENYAENLVYYGGLTLSLIHISPLISAITAHSDEAAHSAKAERPGAE